MRNTQRIRIGCGLFLSMALWIGSLNASSEAFEEIMAPRFQQRCIVPFIVDCHDSQEVFVNTVWGVSIVSVEVDGVTVAKGCGSKFLRESGGRISAARINVRLLIHGAHASKWRCSW
jgi:hypothetical protein